MPKPHYPISARRKAKPDKPKPISSRRRTAPGQARQATTEGEDTGKSTRLRNEVARAILHRHHRRPNDPGWGRPYDKEDAFKLANYVMSRKGKQKI